MEILASLLAAVQKPAFELWGAPASWLELSAFALAIAMVVFNSLQWHWSWPCATLSSMLYMLVFAQNKLYGDAGLQVFFALMALWGWWQWLRGVRSDGSALLPSHIPRQILCRDLGFSLAIMVVLGLFLEHSTDTDVPWWDAVPTALSITATVWVARKYVENWPAWIVINAISVSLYAYKGLWLTVLLYLLLIALAFWGWRAWEKGLQTQELGEPAT